MTKRKTSNNGDTALGRARALPASISAAAKQLYVAFHFVREDGGQGFSHTMLTGIQGLNTVERLQQADAAIKQSTQGLAVVTILGWWPLTS